MLRARGDAAGDSQRLLERQAVTGFTLTMAASTPLFASFDASDPRRVNFSDVAPRTLSPPPPATASAPNLDLQQLEEAWTLRMEQPVEQLERMEAHLSRLIATTQAQITRL
jgi:hypothetical protein